MAEKPVSRHPLQEQEADAVIASSSGGVVKDDRYMATVMRPGGKPIQVDVLGISKAAMLDHNYETETVSP